MSVIVWKMNGDVFTTSFQNAILLKRIRQNSNCNLGMLILLEFVKL